MTNKDKGIEAKGEKQFIVIHLSGAEEAGVSLIIISKKNLLKNLSGRSAAADDSRFISTG